MTSQIYQATAVIQFR